MSGFSSVRVRGAALAIAVLAGLAACSGGGGGGGYYNPNPYPTPTQQPTGAPTSQPTGCASTTAPPASGSAVFYLAPDCQDATTVTGFTVPGDANGTLVVASTTDESLVLAANAVQTAPPSDSVGVAITTGEATSSIRRRSTAPKAPAFRGMLTARTATARRHPHARPLAVRKLAALLASASHGSAHAASVRRSILPTSVGSTANIWTLANGSSGVSYIQVASTLEYSSTYGDVWVDNTLLAANGGPLSSTNIASIGTDYDNAYAATTPVLGSPDYSSSSTGGMETTGSNPGGQCVQNAPIFIPDPDNRQAVFVISSASNGTFGSYFDPDNLVYSDVATSCLDAESNERSGIYVEYDAGASADSQTQQLGENALALGANDLAHLVDFVGHAITNPDQNQTFLSTGYVDTPFILEGLASLAQDFAVNKVYPSVPYDVDGNLQAAQAYLAAPPKVELTAFYGTDAGQAAAAQGCNGCFGVAYLFARYAYDRFGPSYASALVNSGATGFTELAGIFGTTTSPQNVIADFATAMATSGKGLTTDGRFNVSGFTTYGSYTDQFGTALTLTGPDVGTTQSAGTNTTYTLTEGSFTYFGLGGLPAAETVTVTDESSGSTFGLEAALGQS